MSLERRLLAGIALGLLAAFAVLLWAGGATIREVTESYLLTRLEHDRDAVLARLQVGDDSLALAPEGIPAIYRQPLSGHYFVVQAGEQLLRSRSLWDETLPVAPLPPGAQQVTRLTGPAGQPLLVLAGGYHKQGRDLTLLVAEDLSALDDRVRHYQQTLLAGFAVLLLALLALLRWWLRRGFRRLERVQADMHRVAQGELRALDEGVPAEVRPLVRELNRLLALLEQRLARSRNALGNLAHALKTPLSLLIGELERTPADRRDADALTQATRIRELVDRELRRARIAGAGSPGQRFDARGEVPALLEILRRVHRERDLDIGHGELPAQPLAVDREDMLELLGNLLDNACKWAAGRVRVSVEQAPGEIRWVVQDDGGGVTAEDLWHLTARGTRLDEGREGHGLGLAIARDIAEQYGGDLAFDRSPELGGLRVKARLRTPA